MQAKWQGKVLAESDDTIVIEGNHYFPPDSVNKEFLVDSSLTTECPWKGHAQYYTVDVNGQQNEDAAWYYSSPKESAIERVGEDFSNYVAFWHGVTVSD